jgi:hypothetical protein
MKIILSTVLLLLSMSAMAEDGKVDKLLDEFAYSQPQQQQIAQPAANNDLTMFMAQASYREMQEQHKLYLLIGILIFTPIFLWLVLVYIRKCDSLDSEGVVHASGLVLIIQSTTFIVIAAPTSEQLTAAIGVLAAIAGYLFGSSSKKKQEKEGTAGK